MSHGAQNLWIVGTCFAFVGIFLVAFRMGWTLGRRDKEIDVTTPLTSRPEKEADGQATKL